VGHKESEVRNLGVTLIPKSKGEEDIRQLIPKDVDIIHLFSSPKFEFEKPLIVTCHGNGQVGEKFHRNTVFLSKKHAENHNSKAYVYNGIDLEEYPFGERKKNNWKDFLFLAKASWKVKNLNHCLKACKNQKKQLHIAGGWKLTFSSFIHSYGLVNQVQKIQLLKKCDALLWPVRWHEPFGIAVIEAMAMGLPVISSSYGSLPELLSPETGILCKNYEDFERAISVMPKNYDSLELRDYVSQKFSSKIMVNNYLKLYEKVLNKEFLNLQEPRYLSTENPQKLLDF
jgi:glycosyltransferase involved in cell wall biosynthesis